MKRFAGIGIFYLAVLLSLSGQEWLGYHTSNYAGIHGVQYNPAFIAGNNYRLDISIIAGNVHLANNFLAADTYALLSEEKLAASDFSDRYLHPDWGHEFYDAIFHANIQAPAFMWQFTDRDAIGFAPRVRAFLNVDHLDRAMARLIWEELDYPPLFNQRQNNPYFGLNQNLWAEYGLTYARSIIESRHLRIKAGVTAKVLQGLGATYFTARDYGYEFHNSDSLSLYDVDVRMGYSRGFENNQFIQMESPSLGIDLGVIIEYIPGKYDKLGMIKPRKYRRTGGVWADDETPYAFRVGASLIDLGALSYRRAQDSRYVIMNADTMDWNYFANTDGVSGLNELLRNRFADNGSGGNSFTMELPTHINLFGDFRFPHHLGLHMGAVIPFFGGRANDNRNHFNFQVAFTGRWEKKWFGAYVPLAFDDLGLVHWGLSLRMGPLVIGSGNLFTNLMGKMQSLNVHFGLRIIFPDVNQGAGQPNCAAYGVHRPPPSKKRKK